MTIPATPTNEQEAIQYAREMETIHNSHWVPIKRKVPINHRWAINYHAVEAEELESYLEEWVVIPG